MPNFIETILEKQDWIELRGIKPDSAQKLWSKAGELHKLIGKLRSMNKDAYNIYFSPNPRKGHGLSGDTSVDLCRCLFVDFDSLVPTEGQNLSDIALSKIKDAGLPKPTAVISSGHGIHCYWRLFAPLEPGFWSDTQKRLNATVKSDPSIKNPERIMRLPGFLNTKSEPYVMCEVVYIEPDKVYDIDGLSKLLVELKPEPEPIPAKPAERPKQMEHKARAMLYASKWECVSEGQGRNNAAYKHACQLRRDFDLPESEAWEILSAWNASNNPPLTEQELRQAFNGADKYGKRPVGTKLSESRRPAIKHKPRKDPLAEYQERNRRVASGELICLPLPWYETAHLARCGTPKGLVIIAGLKGAAKTFFELEWLRYLLAAGIPASAYWLEGDNDDLFDRTLAQASGIADVTDLDWRHDNAETLDKLTEQHQDELDRVGNAVTVSAGLGLETLEDIAKWIESQAKEGKKAIFVDPISAATRKAKPWESDPAFVRRAKRAARDYECTVVLVTHLIKGAEEGKPDKVAGSAAYGNFSDCVLQLIRHDRRKSSLIKTCVGKTEIEHTHTLYIEKARAPGTGFRLAYDLTEGLRFAEHGVIIKGGQK